jgi:hypothetical protein
VKKLVGIAVRDFVHRVVGHTCGVGRTALFTQGAQTKASVGISHFLLLKAKGVKQ